MVVQNVLTLRTKQTVSIGWSSQVIVMLVVKAVIDNGVWQVLRVEELLVTVGNDRGFWCHPHAFENLFIGCVDFAIAVHLITENIGKDKGNWRDIGGDDGYVGLVNFQNGQPFLLWLGCGDKRRNDSLLHV